MAYQQNLRYEQINDPISQHMQRDIATLRHSDLVSDCLNEIRNRKLSEAIVYFYVIDDDGKLCGVVPVRRLLMSPLEERVSSIMIDRVISIPESATLLEACETFLEHRFLAFPVVDGDGRVAGVVDINLFTDEIITTARQHQVDQAFQMIGIHVSSGRRVSAWASFKDRFPWLLCNIAGGILCAVIAGLYESLISLVTMLALFIPIVLALSESVSMQSMTLTLQGGLLQRKVSWKRIGGMLWKEFITAIRLGAGCAVLVGITAFGWKGDAMVALSVGVCIGLSMVTACLLGVLLPAIVHALRVDPKIAAGPIVLATADILTLLFYFNLSGMLLL